MHQDVVAEINTDALVGNVRAIQACCGPDVAVCAVLKSNAYGHEARIVGPVLEWAGVSRAAVATIDEAITLRESGFSGSVLCFGPVFAAPSAAERAERLAAVVAYDLSPTLVDGHGARALDAAARKVDHVVNVHVNVDTGMTRLGVAPSTAIRLIREIIGLSHLRLTGLYTHLANAEAEDSSHAREQLQRFGDVEFQLRIENIRIPVRHAANSAALLCLPDSHWDMVRPGLLVYGCLPTPSMRRPAGLRPVLKLRAPLVLVKHVPTGTPVGYGSTFVTGRPSRLGVVPIGYNDGYLRGFSNRAVMGLAGGDAPVVGRVSMDQCVLDLTDRPEAKVGDSVVVIDDRPDRPNSLEALAQLIDTVPYELACLLGNRIRRVATGSRSAAVNYRAAPATTTGNELLTRAGKDRRRVHRRSRPSPGPVDS